MRLFILVPAFALALVATALAGPLVELDGGKPRPGVVTEWSADGKKVELTLADGTDAADVAAAIEAGVDRIRAKVKAKKVLVLGKTLDELLPELAKIDLDAESDELDALAEAALRSNEVDSGSSLRAKKTANIEALLQERELRAIGRVVSVSKKAFPEVDIRIRILSAPSGALGKTVRKGKTLTFRPVFKIKNGIADLADTQTQTNVGAYFLKKGDRVKIRVSKVEAGYVLAEVIAR